MPIPQQRKYLNVVCHIEKTMIENIRTDECVWTNEKSDLVPYWSFSKVILSAIALKLVERNQLFLDEPIEKCRFTLRQILQHTSGLADYGYSLEYQSAVIAGEKPWGVEKLLKKLQIEKLLFEPGTRWSYSNFGFLFVRKEIEKVTNCDLNEAAKEVLFKKLNVEDIFVANSLQDMAKLSTTSLKYYHPHWVYHGLFCGTLSSSTKILHSIMTGQILQETSLTKMLMPYNLGGKVEGRPWLHPSYGLGIMIDESIHWRAYGHGGQGPHSSIAVFHFKDSQPRTIGVFHESEHYNLLEEQLMDLRIMSVTELSEKYGIQQ